jgi:hypothetical protein
MIYLLAAIGLSPGGSSTVHIYTQTIHRTTQITTEKHKWQLILKSASSAPSLQVLPWHFPYKWGKNINRKIICILISNYIQQNATFPDLFIFTDALQVSGGFSAHHQEHITVHTASGIVNQYCC